MTFTELHEKYWKADDEKQPSILSDLDPATRKAWDIIRMLEGRKGFEYWWNPNAHGGMPEDCNDEIFEEMIKIIESNDPSDSSDLSD